MSHPELPRLLIELKEPKDGAPSLACCRADGSRTWARVHPFFPAHDLTHCALESSLGLREAFFGLVASGWDLDDFAAPGAASRLPDEAVWAEHLVGLIERRVATDPAGLLEALRSSLPPHRQPPGDLLTPGRLAQFTERRRTLLERWRSLEPGRTLTIHFPEAEAVV